MLKIVDLKRYEIKHGIDYKLENGVCLFDADWNGEYYSVGATETELGWDNNGHIYMPVYGENDNIIGFEERWG